MIVSQYMEEALYAIAHNMTTYTLGEHLPLDPCSICGKGIYFYWHSENKPSYRHADPHTCNDVRMSEYELYKNAKSFLFNYLNKGNKVIFDNFCSQCERSCYMHIPETKWIKNDSVANDKYGNDIFDLACFESNGNVLLGINIITSHKNNNLFTHGKIAFVEIEACEVIAKLSRGQSLNPPIIKDIRYKIGCGHTMCIPMIQLAEELGYRGFISRYATSSRRLVDAAMTGSYYELSKTWLKQSALCRNKDKRHFANEFIRRQKCIRCYNKCQISLLEPYCDSCAKTIINIAKTSKYRKYISETLKYRLWYLLSWLDTVPGNWEYGAACSFCFRNYLCVDDNFTYSNYWEPGTQHVSTKILWFGDEKRCCTVCLEARCSGISINLESLFYLL